MLSTKDIILRDFKESDMEIRMSWETTETEWQRWDSPWEFEGLTGAAKQTRLQEIKRRMKEWLTHTAPASEKRKRFQIETKGTEPEYIGWVASYCITEHYVFTRNITSRCAIGIDIPVQEARGHGYAYQALSLFIEYLLKHGETDLYIQTWSGNERMIHIAEKMGFVECGRRKNARTVRGRSYDALTFQMDQKKYTIFKENFIKSAETE